MRSKDDGPEAGYALVDALVGMLILALAVIFSLDAGHEARVVADQAQEVSRAHTLLTQLLESGPRSFNDATGTSGAFDWTIETRTTGGERPIAVCHRQVKLTNVATKRAYQAATLETCPVEDAG
ncbi:hypothetical protein [Phenylobacterium sp.]|uniref:hypothetical protein n=1 Tax=Phenylobacterium sp. TaxID=1871053 RepID=UPI002E323CA6|nr:hypothetical protein [Phenylobacterium sp.]HEX3365603.1 hypothetical protein [Phenylobacterium sp.]